MLPVPAEPKLSVWVLALPIATSSFASFAGSDGCAYSTTGVRASSAIGSKSLSASYCIFGCSAGLVVWLLTTMISV